MNFDDHAAHTLVCQQANTDIPQEHRECVCPAHVTAIAIEQASQKSLNNYNPGPPVWNYMLVPASELEGTFEGGPYATADRIRTWALRIGVFALASFAAGALLRHFAFV